MTVNPQITDSVTQADTNTHGETATQAIADLNQNFAHSMAILFQNTVLAQQQSNTTAQASAVQGVETILSVDTAAIQNPDFLKNMTDATDRIQAAVPGIPETEIPPLTPGGSSDLPREARAMATALAASIEVLGRATTQNLLRIVELAATATCLSAMIAQPDKAAAYEQILAAIRKQS